MRVKAPMNIGSCNDNGLIPCKINCFVDNYQPNEIVGFTPEQVANLKDKKNVMPNGDNKTIVPVITPLVKMQILRNIPEYPEANLDSSPFIAVSEEVAKKLEKSGEAIIANPDNNYLYDLSVALEEAEEKIKENIVKVKAAAKAKKKIKDL